MGRRKLNAEEAKISKQKRQEYLKKWRTEYGMEYYKRNKEEILKKKRAKREKEKGKPLNSYNKIDLKNMTKEEKNAYFARKNRESRARNKGKMKYYIENCGIVEMTDNEAKVFIDVCRKIHSEKIFNCKPIKYIIKEDDYEIEENEDYIFVYCNYSKNLLNGREGD